ncbi:MAG: serine/threonine protein kinase bacterial, partial [bacterium]
RHVAEGLQYLASLHIVHADLKPENILVRADKSLVVADLGRSIVATTPQATNGIRGSLFYASPEILRHTGITPVADVFSLGLILFEWAAGELPHTRPWEDWSLSASELVEVLKARVGTNNWLPILPAPYTADFTQLVQGMLKAVCAQRLTAAQVLATSLITESRGAAFDVPIGLTGDDAITARQAVAERTAHMGQIATLARNSLALDKELKASRVLVADLGQQLEKQRSNANIAGEELTEAKKSAAHAKAGESRALEEARLAHASVAQLQASFTETIRQLKGPTSVSPAADGSVSITAKEVRQIEDIHATNAFRLNRVGGELAQVADENHRLRME